MVKENINNTMFEAVKKGAEMGFDEGYLKALYDIKIMVQDGTTINKQNIEFMIEHFENVLKK